MVNWIHYNQINQIIYLKTMFIYTGIIQLSHSAIPIF